MTKILNAYYRRGNKLFFRYGNKKTVVEKTSTGRYTFYGDVITGVKLNITF
jgi:hypothetical protein